MTSRITSDTVVKGINYYLALDSSLQLKFIRLMNVTVLESTLVSVLFFDLTSMVTFSLAGTLKCLRMFQT